MFELYFNTFIVFFVMSVFLNVFAFLYAFFIDADSSANKALGIAYIVFTVVLAFLANTIPFINVFPFMFACVITSVSVIVTIRCELKSAQVTAWIAVGVSIVIGLVCYLLPYLIGLKLYADDGTVITNDNIAIFIALICVAVAVGIGFMTASTIIRKKRVANGTLDIDDEGILASFGIGYVLTVLSFACFLYGLSYLFYSLNGNRLLDFFIVTLGLIVVSVILGSVGWFFLKTDFWVAGDPISTIVSFWSWFCIMITIVVLITGLSLRDPYYKKPGKRLVTDEKGEKHVIDYQGGDGKEAVDEKGTVWVTEDGGKSFRKRDLYVYDNPNGKKEYLRDPYGTTGGKSSTLIRSDGTQFCHSKSGEMKEWRLANYDDGSPRETIDMVNVSDSEFRKAQVIKTPDIK